MKIVTIIKDDPITGVEYGLKEIQETIEDISEKTMQRYQQTNNIKNRIIATYPKIRNK